MIVIDPRELHKWLKADYEQGSVYWKHRRKGVNITKPIGCLDSNGYVKVSFHGQSTYVHRIVYAMFHNWWPEKLIDHMDRVRNNNSIRNLREATYSGNALNYVSYCTNTSGVKGASITPYGNYKVSKAGVYLGTFKTRGEAEDAYNRHA